MIEGIQVLCHSSIRIEKGKIIYIDPFKLEDKYNDADVIFITHSHWDHYSLEDINKVRKENTMFVATQDVCLKLLEEGINEKNIFNVEPNKDYVVEGIKFETIPAYNPSKEFHPKENNWVGYIINLKDIRYYIAGDTDITEENLKVKCDVALVPVGGTYTMDYTETAKLVNVIKPKVAIPTHYGEIVGNKSDGKKFIELLDPTIKGIELI